MVEFMPPQRFSSRTDRTICEQAGPAIAEVELALGEARRVAEQPCHLVARALAVLQAFAQHHVTAAFAVHRPGPRKIRKSAVEAARCGEPPRVQFRIAARQPAYVATVWWSFVRERRKRRDLGTGCPPAVEDMRIDEGEG